MPLNKNQKRAVEYLEGPLLVIAGPGTGKTQLLSHKVAYILEHTDTNPENILCMTFTEVGAANMRERLKSIIGPAGQKVNISTYHSFGSEILAQYDNYAEDYPRRLEQAVDEVQRYQIVKSIQSALPGGDILRKDNVKKIISIISAAKSAGLSHADMAKIAAQNLEDSRVLSQTIAPLLENIVPRQFRPSYEQAYRPIYEILQPHTEAEIIVGNIERIIGGIARDLKAAIVEAKSSERIKPLTAWKDAYFEKDGKGAYRLKDRVANKKLASIAKVMEQYDKYLKDNALYDFDDMIQEAVRVLKQDAGFRATLQERYQFIMLDEFQDTNPSQFAIIKALTDYEQPQVMAVGDDDQAIYEFQGALSTNMTDFQAHYGAEVITLTENYRSTQEILDFSHHVIQQAPDRFADKELTAHQPSPETSQIYRYEFLASDMEYAWIADKAAQLISQGVPQSQIAIISYKTKYFLPLLPYLKSHPEVNIAYEKQDDLLEDPELHQLLTVARYVWEVAREKRVDTSPLEVFSYPWWGLPPLEVVKIIEQARRNKRTVLEELSASKIAGAREVAEFVAHLAARSFTEPLEVWLDYLIGAAELDGYQSQFLKYHTAKSEYAAYQLYENLAALRGKLRRHYGDKPLRLADLIQLEDDYRTAEMVMSKASPYRDADEAVQILSAHKAKGLEFEHVFIISADHMAWGKGKGNNTTLSLPKNLTQIAHTGMTDGERLRILYVAMTRAKRSLYITNSLRDFNGKSPDRLEYLQEYTEGDAVICPFLPTKQVSCEYQASAPRIAAVNLRNWLQPYLRLTPDMRSLYRERMASWRMSPTALTSFVDIVYSGPQQFFHDYVLRAPRPPEDESLALGNLIHATFEAVTKQGLSDAAAEEYFATELDVRDLAPEVMRAIREQGLQHLSIALKEFGPILRQGQAEVDLGPDKLVIGGVPMTGKIDHIIINESQRTLEIYDFKTSQYKSSKWQSHLTLYKYMLQLEFYKLLLNHSRKYAGYRIERAHILFTTPDKDGHVYDKVYEFSAPEEAELLQLAQAVWSQVSTLKFMDDPELFIEADKNKKLADIKDFITLLLAKSSHK